MWEIDDAVEVHSVAVDGLETPDQFLWRGRLWRVCSVESHWTETAVWWERGIIGTGYTYDPRASEARMDRTIDARADHRTAAEGSLARIDAAAVAEACSAARPATRRPHKTGVAAPATPHPRPAATLPSTAAHSSTRAASPAAVGVLDAEWGPQRAVFRVEAGCGRFGRRELFDLAHDPDSGRWQLERVTDR